MKRLSLATAMLLTLGFTSLTAVTASAAILNRDINSYVLFALDELHFKGQNAEPGRGQILGGNIGVNRSEPNTNNFLMTLGGASAEVVVSDDVQVVADSMQLSIKFQSQSINPGQVDLFSNRFGQLPAATNYRSTDTFADPILTPPDLPFDPADNTSTTDVTVLEDQTDSLLPGMYRDVWLKDGATLNLTAGVYYMRNLKGGKQVTVNLTDDTILYINGQFFMNEEPHFGIGTNAGAKVYVASINDTFNDLGHNDNSVHFGRGGLNNPAIVYGQFYAPFGILDLGNGSDLYGRFWARLIDSDFNVNITLLEPPEGGPLVPEPRAALLVVLGAAMMIYRPRRA
jgi:hypothetical protein